ncbi:fasciclin domain-containing protein [Brevundimonas vesicularis]|uniref:fasciclin domain-containing protein n=1 Tax=Brevundimonas vesicularis TaxID=41276 RepID=UPI0038D38787
MLNRSLTLTGLALTATLGLAACGNNEREAPAAPVETTANDPLNPATTAPAGDPTTMNPGDNLIANASRAPNLTTLVSAIQTAGLQDTLQGAGPFTVFAPDNAAFDKIPAATREAWMQPAQKTALSRLLTYHVVPGRLTAADLANQASSNNSTATLTTVQGGKLTVRDAGNGTWTLTDAKGGTSTITQADLAQSNGVIHIVDTVLMPN